MQCGFNSFFEQLQKFYNLNFSCKDDISDLKSKLYKHSILQTMSFMNPTKLIIATGVDNIDSVALTTVKVLVKRIKLYYLSNMH